MLVIIKDSNVVSEKSYYATDKAVEDKQMAIDLIKSNPQVLENLGLHSLGIVNTDQIPENLLTVLAHVFSNELVQDLQAINNGMAEIYHHFRDSGGAANFADRFAVNWNAFATRAKNGIAPNDLPRLALSFIHRFDGLRFFLTVEQCMLSGTGPTSAQNPHVLTHLGQGHFFDVSDGQISNTDPGQIGMHNNFPFGQDYFQQIEYNDGGVWSPLDLSSNVRSATMSWFEFEKMFAHNSHNNPDEIAFCNITTEVINPGPFARWPHSLAIHMRAQGHNLLTSGATAAINYFRDRAANYNSICPPNCARYHWHQDLTFLFARR